MVRLALLLFLSGCSSPVVVTTLCGEVDSMIVGGEATRISERSAEWLMEELEGKEVVLVELAPDGTDRYTEYCWSDPEMVDV